MWDDFIRSLADELINHLLRTNPLFISIIGLDRTGKTTIRKSLVELLEERATFYPLAGYLKKRDVRYGLGMSAFHPEAFDYERARADLTSLVRNGYTDVPIYSHELGVADRKETIRLNNFVISDELFAFYDTIRDFYDFRIYVQADDSVRLQRRLKADPQERGYSSPDYINWDFKTKLRNFNEYFRNRIQLATLWVDTTRVPEVLVLRIIQKLT